MNRRHIIVISGGGKSMFPKCEHCRRLLRTGNESNRYCNRCNKHYSPAAIREKRLKKILDEKWSIKNIFKRWQQV